MITYAGGIAMEFEGTFQSYEINDIGRSFGIDYNVVCNVNALTRLSTSML